MNLEDFLLNWKAIMNKAQSHTPPRRKASLRDCKKFALQHH